MEDKTHEPVHKKTFKQRLKYIYEVHYKKLLVIPFLFIILAIAQISYQVSTTGDFMNRGVTLKGGLSIELPHVETTKEEMSIFLEDSFPDADFDVRKEDRGISLEASGVEFEPLKAKLEEKLGPLSEEDYSKSQTGSSLGRSFFRETFTAIILSFIFMGIVVLITFRVLSPSLAVIAAAFSDLLVTLAIFNLTGMKMSIAGIAAFLMLIGYSVDTDILLSTRVLKHKRGSVMDRIYSSMKTGLTMTFTTMGAVVVALIVAKSETIIQIMTVLFIGLWVDIIMTYLQNVAIIRWYLEKKNEPNT